MRKFLNLKTFIFSTLLLTSIAIFTVAAISNTPSYKNMKASCLKPSEKNGELLWDIVSRKLGNFISIH